MNRGNFIQFTGKIHLVINDDQLETIANALTEATELGFDTETRPSFKKGDVFNVALLQLATEHEAFLIRLRQITRFQILKEVFQNERALKVGVAIRDDIKSLQKLFPFEPRNFVELQDVAKASGLKNFGLKGMTEEVLGASISKRAKTSNWEAHTLSPQQLTYAATDAWVGLELFHKIRKMKPGH